MKNYMLFILFTLLTSWFMNAQDLNKHQWKHRVIIIKSPTFENEEALRQLTYLANKREDLVDRKLVVYHVTNEGYTYNFNEEIEYFASMSIKNFNVSLLGLDGTTKFDKNTAVKAVEFFALIDTMPMRQAEIRHR